MSFIDKIEISRVPRIIKIKGTTSLSIGAITWVFVEWLEYATNVYSNPNISLAIKIQTGHISNWGIVVYLVALFSLVIISARK